MNIRFTTKTHTIDLDKKNRVQVSLLYVEDTETGRSVLHPLNSFLEAKHMHSSEYTTERSACQYISRFLNWAKADGITDISELVISDFERFMTETAYNSNIKLRSLELMRTNLSQFAEYLEDNDISPKLMVQRIEYIGLNGQHRLKPNIIYRKPARLKREATTKIRMIRPEYLKWFLDTAVRTAPDIALGVLFSFTGGLRSGEVVNLSKSSYELIGPYGSNGFVLDVKQRNLRPDRATGGVKKQRKQKTIGLGEIAENILKMHLQNYLGPGEALFTNRDGKPMTVQSYFFRFNRIKKAFIKELEDGDLSDYAYAMELKTRPWSTHIGRGTFSNTIAKVCNGNPGILAAARGDSSPASSMPYLDLNVVMQDASKVLETWYKTVEK